MIADISSLEKKPIRCQAISKCPIDCILVALKPRIKTAGDEPQPYGKIGPRPTKRQASPGPAKDKTAGDKPQPYERTASAQRKIRRLETSPGHMER